MSQPFHLHFVVHGPWSFVWEGDPPETPGTSANARFKDGQTFVQVDLPDGSSENRTIPCRIEPGEIARVYSQIVPDQLSSKYAQRKASLVR